MNVYESDGLLYPITISKIAILNVIHKMTTIGKQYRDQISTSNRFYPDH
jgi:hypothetical protein